MTNNTIIKLIELIDNDKKQDAKILLTEELLKNDKNTRGRNTQFNAVKSFLAHNRKEYEDRSELSTILNYLDKQFILSSTSMFIFEKYVPEFEVLDNAKGTKIYRFTDLLIQGEYVEMNEDDLFLLNNISKFIDYHKVVNSSNKDIPLIYFANRIFNAKILLEASKILNDLDNLKIIEIISKSAIQIKNKDVTALLMSMPPQNINKSLVENETKEFINKMKECNEY